MKFLKAFYRVRNDTVQTAAVTMRQPQTASTITLVGMVHIGTNDYYQSVKQLVQDLEDGGATVHYELVASPPDDKLDEIFGEEIANDVRVMKLASGAFRNLMQKMFGVVYQSEGLKIGEHWENHDVNLETYVAILGRKRLIERTKRSLSLVVKHSQEEEKANEAMRTLFRLVFRFPVIANLLHSLIGEDSKFILDHRNTIAVAAVGNDLQKDHSKSFVLLWGAAHLPGLIEAFNNLGYQVQGQPVWLDAFEL